MYATIRPALCKLQVEPHDKPGWVWERKYDGVRMLVIVGRDGRVRLQSRSGKDKTAMFPELVDGLGVVAPIDSVLDGEVVGSRGLSFQDFAQRRANRTKGIEEIAKELPAFFVAFDAIRLGGRDLDRAALLTRRALLVKAVYGENVVWPTENPTGIDMFQCAKDNDWEGIVGKRLAEGYMFGKRAWLKVKVWQEGVFRVTGWAAGKGKREGMAGAFTVEDFAKDLKAEVGTGFDAAELETLTRLVKTCEQPVYFRIKYMEVTNAGSLRFPVYLGLAARPLGPNEQATCKLVPHVYCEFDACPNHMSYGVPPEDTKPAAGTPNE